MGDMGVGKCSDDLRVHNHEVVDDEVGDERAAELVFVVNGKRFC